MIQSENSDNVNEIHDSPKVTSQRRVYTRPKMLALGPVSSIILAGNNCCGDLANAPCSRGS
jgi:hypothetical protein